MYAALTGGSALLLVSPRGKIEGTDLGELVRALEGDEDFKSIVPAIRERGPGMMQDSFFPLPEGPVRPGDTWKDSREIEIPGVGRVTSSGTYTLRSVQEGRAKIDLKLSITLARDPEASAPFEIREGSGEGSLEFDVEAGNPASVRTATKLVIERASKSGVRQTMTLRQTCETVRE
jgi:hypothetical protein